MKVWIQTSGRVPPVDEKTLVEVKRNNGRLDKAEASEINWDTVTAFRVIGSQQQVAASEVLTAAAKHMADRAATYDKPEGERSMDATVRAFNALCRRDLSESEGWLLLACLKASRLFQRPGFHQDSAEDMVAYCALMAESKSKE